ncbi:hypothetical protein H4219_003297 [Mycoemilia scoparia]|uniref:Uncharacterized protein n=1 Tax=Mycoemilia scoparia TaxID=417184 RepID=A0A9W8DTK4_9FUNG|nr:hypothetical protein H4219_003297 [Mycoemilia scoparia]
MTLTKTAPSLNPDLESHMNHIVTNPGIYSDRLVRHLASRFNVAAAFVDRWLKSRLAGTWQCMGHENGCAGQFSSSKPVPNNAQPPTHNGVSCPSQGQAIDSRKSSAEDLLALKRQNAAKVSKMAVIPASPTPSPPPGFNINNIPSNWLADARAKFPALTRAVRKVSLQQQQHPHYHPYQGHHPRFERTLRLQCASPSYLNLQAEEVAMTLAQGRKYVHTKANNNNNNNNKLYANGNPSGPFYSPQPKYHGASVSEPTYYPALYPSTIAHHHHSEEQLPEQFKHSSEKGINMAGDQVPPSHKMSLGFIINSHNDTATTI